MDRTGSAYLSGEQQLFPNNTSTYQNAEFRAFRAGMLLGPMQSCYMPYGERDLRDTHTALFGCPTGVLHFHENTSFYPAIGIG